MRPLRALHSICIADCITTKGCMGTAPVQAGASELTTEVKILTKSRK